LVTASKMTQRSGLYAKEMGRREQRTVLPLGGVGRPYITKGLPTKKLIELSQLKPDRGGATLGAREKRTQSKASYKRGRPPLDLSHK